MYIVIIKNKTYYVKSVKLDDLMIILRQKYPKTIYYNILSEDNSDNHIKWELPNFRINVRIKIKKNDLYIKYGPKPHLDFVSDLPYHEFHTRCIYVIETSKLYNMIYIKSKIETRIRDEYGHIHMLFDQRDISSLESKNSDKMNIVSK